MKTYTKESLIIELQEIRSRGWIESAAGGIGRMNKLYVVSIYKKGWSKTSIFVLIAPDKEAAFGRLKQKYYGDLAEHQCSFHNIHGDSLDDITEISYM